jgi:carotenoid 1,2-hydratase
MLALSDPRIPMPEALLDTPGGFLWWYVDLVDGHGNGAVLIWSWGLPFLPGVAGSARRGRPQPPRSRPSINLSIYRAGRLDFYLFQELDPDAVSWTIEGETERWRFGASQLHTRRAAGRRRLVADLDLALPDTADRFTGALVVEGPELQPPAEPERGPHAWTPLVGPAAGELTARAGGWRSEVRGDAYFDRNGGERPLHELGIHSWTWGRAAVGGAQWIYYLVEPEVRGDPRVATVLRVGADGAVRRWDGVEVQATGWRPSRFGPGYRPTLRLLHEGRELLRVRQQAPVDSGPFYLRLPLTLTTPAGASGPGWGEVVLPHSVDLLRHRFFVKMRVHNPRGDNSIWLPLFTGPSQGRLRRLLSGGDVLPALADKAAS